MIPDVSRREVTLREWWDMRRDSWHEPGGNPVSFNAVQMWRRWWDGVPAPSRMVGRTALYYLSDLDRWKRRYPDIGTGR